MIYPWLEQHWAQLQTRRLRGQLPHGLLFSGPGGIGKRQLAATFAAALLCRRPTENGLACGECEACRLIQAGTHPDFLQVGPLPEKQHIVVDQIRELCAGLALKSHAGGYQVATIVPAEQMNTAAANSLLKTLEEPSDNTLLILITEQPGRLPATIRSRCQQLRFPVPAADAGEQWLERQGGEKCAGLLLRLADGAPLRALELAQQDILMERRRWLGEWMDILRGKVAPPMVAQGWVGDSELRPLYWLGSFVMDLIRLRNDSIDHIKNIDMKDVLDEASKLVSDRDLHLRLDRIQRAQRLAVQSSVNRQLLLEELLIPWYPAGRRQRSLA